MPGIQPRSRSRLNPIPHGQQCFVQTPVQAPKEYIDLYPTFAALAGASTAKGKPLDGLNVRDTIVEVKPSPRTEVVYNIEPYRCALRQGDWKLIWRTILPTKVELFE